MLAISQRCAHGENQGWRRARNERSNQQLKRSNKINYGHPCQCKARNQKFGGSLWSHHEIIKRKGNPIIITLDGRWSKGWWSSRVIEQMSVNSLTLIMWVRKESIAVDLPFSSCEKIIDKKPCMIGDCWFSNMSAFIESQWAVLLYETNPSHEANC